MKLRSELSYLFFGSKEIESVPKIWDFLSRSLPLNTTTHTHSLSLSWQMQYGGDKRQFPGRPLAPFEPWPPSTPVPAPTTTTTTMTMMSTRERRNQNIVKKDNEGCRWPFFLSSNATYPRKQEIFSMPPKKFLKALKFFLTNNPFLKPWLEIETQQE